MTHFSDPVRTGANFDQNGTALPGARMSPIYVQNMVPAAIVTNGIAAAQAVGAAGNLTLNGSLVTSGVATFDVGRAVQIVSTDAADTTQVATFYGTDYWGVPLRENVTFNGTTPVFGKKAFKTITRVAISALMAGNASAGSSDIIGLRYAAVSRNYVITAYNDAQVTTGTFTGAVATTATATTGDVRGTFVPASATDAAKKLTIWIYVDDPDTRSGLYGVAQFNG